MRDSRSPLHVLDLLDAPELWPEARRRAEELSATGRSRAADTSLGSPKRRLLVGVVALAIATAGIGLAIASFLGPGSAPGGSGDQAQIVLSAPAATSDAQLVAASEIIQARLNAADIASGVSVQDGKIVVSLPNESIQGESRGDTLQLVSAAGLFELREVLTVYSPGTPEYDSIQPTCAPGDFTCEGDSVQTGRAVFLDDQGNKYELGPTQLSNGDIERVEAVSNAQEPVVSDGWSVGIGLTPSGADKLANLTSELVGKQLAIVLDEQVLSAPTVQSPIDNGSVQVAGQFTEGQAKTLAEILSAPPLPVALTIIDIVQPSPAIVEPSPSASSDASDVLRMTCAPGGVPHILTPVVMAQPDGLHVLVDNRDGSEAVVFRQQARPWVAWSSGGNSLNQEFVTLVSPGETFVSCKAAVPSVAGSGTELQSDEASFTVVDPHHAWVSTDLACGFSDRWAFRTDSSQRTNSGMTPSEAAKALVPGIGVTDIVEPGGYVGSQGGLVRVVRESEVVAWLTAYSQVDLWSFNGYACPGSDIG
jgi:hypothetical protein